MRSSSGAHYPALDHVRAFAAWLVFIWHFSHGFTGHPVPFGTFRLAGVLDEGHTGVALFMTLSGYLFAKLLDGRAIHYPSFLWNRAIRLLPLLAVVCVVAGPWGSDRSGWWLYGLSLIKGAVLPVLPNGGWSITTEAHFYLVLPLLLWISRQSRVAPLGLIALAVLGRAWWHATHGEVQWLAYWTIVGRIDQFTFGVLAFAWRREIAVHGRAVGAIALAFLGLYTYFDASGGFYVPVYPSPRPLWIVLPTIEGLAYGAVIAWYDGRPQIAQGWLSRGIGRIGEYSYSIYLLHIFWVFTAAQYIHTHIMDLSSFPVATAWGTLGFVLMLIPASLSYRLIERPCLRWRRRYVRDVPQAPNHQHARDALTVSV